MKKPILCLDFDGVIHSYTSGWKGADVISDPPVRGAADFIEKALEHFDVQIYSSRSGQDGGIYAMQMYVKKMFIDQIGLDEEIANEYACFIIGWPTEKPPAKVTIDDRAMTFIGIWPAMEQLTSFKPWNKRT